MDVLKTLAQFLTYFFAALTVLGLYKPWMVFWWSDFANRIKVLQVYGILTFATLLLYLLL